MKPEYRCIKVAENAEQTEYLINKLFQEGWRPILSYCNGYYLILEKDVD